MKHLQFSVKLAYAMTFNCAQGQSLQKYGIILPISVRTHGQLYVGLSHCGDNHNLKIYANQDEFQNYTLPPNQIYTKNVVHTELL